MMKIELNQIPVLLEQGTITKNEAVNFMAEFIYKNYPLFGLHKFDEDFREEIIVNFLEKGRIVLDSFDKRIGNFFPYFYAHITSIINKNIKNRAKNCLNELCTVNQEYSKVFYDRLKYEPLTPLLAAEPKPPYARKKITPEELRAALQNYSSKKERVIVTLLLKYVLYFDENSIYAICKAMNLDPQIILEGSRLCKNTLQQKIERHHELSESRNKSYYYHNRYQSQLNLLTNMENSSEEVNSEVLQKYKHHTNLWQAKNRILSTQASHLVTSNKVIANLLGICERQVRYYLACAKNYSKIFKEEIEKSAL